MLIILSVFILLFLRPLPAIFLKIIKKNAGRSKLPFRDSVTDAIRSLSFRMPHFCCNFINS